MCQGLNWRRIARIIVVAGLAAVSVPAALGQDGSGRSGTARPNSSVGPDEGSVRKRPVKRTLRRVSVPSPKPETPSYGRIAILINEGASILEIKPLEGSASVPTVIRIAARPSSLIIRTLPVGTYTVSARKEGFYEESRSVEIEKGKRQRVEMVLKPKLAILSVSTNVDDAEIMIDKIGSFTGGVRQAMVVPGTYGVTAKRRGYRTRQVSVDLASPGREEFLKLILEPLRIDAVLDLAAENLSKGNADLAEELAKDVLLLNPAHARANLIFASIGYARGSLASVDYFLKAISNGETAAFKVRVLSSQTDGDPADAEIRIGRDEIGFASKDRADINFAIKRADVKQIDRSFADKNAAFVFLSAKSDFYGKPIEPDLRIFSPDSRIGTPCRDRSIGGNCATDVEIIGRVISAWRESRELFE